MQFFRQCPYTVVINIFLEGIEKWSVKMTAEEPTREGVCEKLTQHMERAAGTETKRAR
jgi:hypothetical protein